MQDPNTLKQGLEQESAKIEPQKEVKKQSIPLIILAIVLILIFAGLVVYIVFTLSKKTGEKGGSRTTTETSTKSVTTDTTTDNETTENTSTSSSVEKILYFTHKDYPSLRIPYLSSWSVSVTQSKDEQNPGAKLTTITFEKDNHKLIYTLTPILIFGGVPQCSKENNIIQVQEHWYRIGSNGQYSYDSAAFAKGVSYSDGRSFNDFFENGLMPGNKEDYIYCNYDVPIGSTISVYTVPDNADYSPGENYSGYLDITLEITGSEDSEIIDEADEMVISSTFI